MFYLGCVQYVGIDCSGSEGLLFCPKFIGSLDSQRAQPLLRKCIVKSPSIMFPINFTYITHTISQVKSQDLCLNRVGLTTFHAGAQIYGILQSEIGVDARRFALSFQS